MNNKEDISPEIPMPIIEGVKQALQQQRWNDALQIIAGFVEGIVRNPFCNGVILNLPELDTLCMEIGKTIPATCPPNNTQPSKNIIYITSHLYLTGGHTAVIEDLIRAQPANNHHILITNIYNTINKHHVNNRFKELPVKLYWSNSRSLLKKLYWLKQTWHHINPCSAYLFNHHQDVVAVASATPDMPGTLYYYHHIDFQLGLGKSLPHATHIDMNPLVYSHCQSCKHHRQVYLPLTCHDFGVRSMDPSSFMVNKQLHTASSGTIKKFTWPYPYAYTDLIPEILKATNGTHTHIGPLDSSSIKHIRTKLTDYNISIHTFRHIPHTPNLWETLQASNIDAYLTSFPVGGGRTAIEVMGSGTPIIGHNNCISPFLSELSLIYSNPTYWETPADLLDMLKSITPLQLSEMAQKGRTHYIRHYQSSFLADQLSSNFTAIKPPTIDSTNSLYSAKPIKIDQLLVNISKYMANGDNLDGRALPGLLLSQLKRYLPRLLGK